MEYRHIYIEISIVLRHRYLVAYAPLDNGEQKLTIFDIRTGAEKRSFISDAPMGGSVPILRWSKDDKYFARIGLNTLSVYETPVCIFFKNAHFLYEM